MNETAEHRLELLAREAVQNFTPTELAIGWLRYEALRKLSVQQYAELNRKHLMEWPDKTFDQLVTDLIR